MDSNKTKEFALFRIPASFFILLNPDITEYKLKRKVKNFYLFILIFSTVTLALLFYIFCPVIAQFLGIILGVTIMIWIAIVL